MEFVPARGLCANDGPDGLGLHDLTFKRIMHHAAKGLAAGGVTLQYRKEALGITAQF